jgi:ribosome maturation factor RimP
VDGEEGFSLFYFVQMQGFEAAEKAMLELVSANYPDVFVVEFSLAKGPRSVLSLLVDTDEGITIDKCARISRKLSAWLEENDPFDFPFALEVSSPGLSRPLKLPRQFHKNVGRKLKVKTTDGKAVTGVLEAVDATGITLQPEVKKKPKKSENQENTHIVVAFDAIQEAKIEISFD